MKSLPLAWQQQLQLFFFFAFVSYAFITCISSENYIPDLADYINHLALIVQAKMALVQGQFPLRIAPLEQSGYGYPVYQFFSPTSYWLGAVIYHWITPDNPMIAFKLTVWGALTLGGIYLYRLALWFVESQPAAILAGVVYLAAPYYIIIVNRLGNFNEAIALGVLPATIFYTLQRFYHPNKNSFLILAALTWYLLITIHLVTFIYTAFFVGLLLLGATCKNPRQWYNLVQAGIAFGFGCLLAMWYIAPVAMLSKLFLLSSTFTDPNHINHYHPLLSHLIFPGAAISPDFSNGIMRIHPAVGWPILFGVGICVYAYFHKQKIPHALANSLLPILLSLFALAFLMAWSPFNMWQFLPKALSVGQYSWRVLSQVIWMGALLFSWAILWIFKNNIRLEQLIAAIFIIVISALPWFPAMQVAHITGENNKTELFVLNAFKRNPTLFYNQTAYLLNFTQHPQLVSSIDSILLDPDNILKLTTPFHLSKTVLAFAKTPYVMIAGVLPATQGKPRELTASLNNVTIGKKLLKPGSFEWKIPLVNLPKDTTHLLLQFDISGKHEVLTGLQMQDVLLSGFQDPNTTLRINEVEKNCKQDGVQTLCRIQVPYKIQLLELPVFFYPQMLHITLNGKTVAHESILYKGHLFTAIKPEPGKLNTIAIQFRGLVWANLVSRYSWGFWLFILLLIGVERVWRRPVFDPH